MQKGPTLTTLAVIILGLGACFLVWRQTESGRGHTHSDHAHEGEAAGEAPARGPHGGRILANGPFTCEVTIFERGVPPEFRVYCTQGGKPVAPAAVKLTIELRRLLGRVDVIGFAGETDFLRGDRTVEEPHSFAVKVVAEHAGVRHQWEYASHEGRVEITPELAQASGVVVEEASPAVIRTSLTLYGKLVPDAERVAHVGPRFPGVVKEARKRLGEAVAKDETLVVIQSNDSLQTYTVASPIAGTVIQKHVTPGEVVHEDDEMFVVCDLGLVWATFDVPQRDAARVKPGQALAVRVEGEDAPRASRVAHVSPMGIESTQAVRIRAELENAEGKLRPGLFVTGEVVLDEARVPLAVKAAGLQRFRDWDVVFIQDGNLFEIRPLELGRRDADWVEVLSGLAPGQKYAAAGSFLLRADVGKSGATHDH